MNQPAKNYSNWMEMLADPRYADSGKAVLQYLTLTEGLESPTPYHIWSFLSLISALCGSRITLQHGPTGNQKLNLGVILSGAPAIRKSTALTVMQKFAEGLPIYYGPTDTAGQRQGIMSAMLPRWQVDSDDEDPTQLDFDSLESLAEYDSDSVLPTLPDPVTRRASEIYFVSKELGRLLSAQSRELLDFFTDGMDGESFHYQLKNQVIKIAKPLISLIGATTPASLGAMMPRGASEHGFLSRIIFVHATELTQSVPIPAAWTDHHEMIRKKMHERILDMITGTNTEVTLSENAERTFKDLYGYRVGTSDVRLMAYAGRRQTHLLKVAALLAILRGETPVRVTSADLRLSHGILAHTEVFMDRAFYGLDTGLYSKVLCAACELAEGSSDGQFSLGMMHRQAGYLATREVLSNMLQSLQDQGKIKHRGGPATDPFWEIADTESLELQRKQRIIFRGSASQDDFVSHETVLKQA